MDPSAEAGEAPADSFHSFMEQGGPEWAAGAALIDEINGLANAGSDASRPLQLQAAPPPAFAALAEVAEAILQKKPARVRELIEERGGEIDFGAGDGAVFRLALRWDGGFGCFRALAEGADWGASGTKAVIEAALSGGDHSLLTYLGAGRGDLLRQRAYDVFERAAWGRSYWEDRVMRIAGVVFPRSKRLTEVSLRILLGRMGTVSSVSSGGAAVTVAWPAVGEGLRGRPRFAAAEVRSVLSRIRTAETLSWFLSELAAVPTLEKEGLEFLLQEMGAKFRPELFFPGACALCLRVGPQLVDLASIHDWLVDLYGEEDRLGPTPVAVLVDLYLQFPRSKIDVFVFEGLVTRTTPDVATEAVALIKTAKETMSKSERLARWGVLKVLKKRANGSEEE